MSESEPSYVTTSIEPADAKAGFSCGNHALDDFFARHAGFATTRPELDVPTCSVVT